MICTKIISNNYVLVVWNPWDVTSNTMNDFGDDEYPNMICVEAGMVITPITLNPNNTYEGTMVLQVYCYLFI